MGALAYLCDDTRSDWGARPANGAIYTAPIQDKDQFLTHYNGGPLGLLDGDPHTACLARVRAIQADHLSKWSDIGYNTLVCPHGRLIEGRGVLAVGAQCPGYNRSGVGSQLMVGGTEKATPLMLNRQRAFYDRLVELRGGEATRKMGHRDGVATSCPGDYAYGWVKAGMPLNYGGTVPVPAPTPTPTPAPAPAPDLIPGPEWPFPLPSSDYYFGRDDGTKFSVSGYYERWFKGKTARSWIQEYGSQMTRRGWSVGVGKTWLPTDGNNGYFGREYEALVKRFQQEKGLRVDGRLGPKTWHAAFHTPVN